MKKKPRIVRSRRKHPKSAHRDLCCIKIPEFFNGEFVDFFRVSDLEDPDDWQTQFSQAPKGWEMSGEPPALSEEMIKALTDGK